MRRSTDTDEISRNVDDTYVFNAATGLYLPHSYRKRKWVKPMMQFLTLVLLTFTVYFARKQWKEMVRATDASKQAAIAAQNAADVSTNTFKLTYRPRIKVLSISPNNVSNSQGVVNHNLDKGRLTVMLNAPNTGPFAARNVRFFVFDNVSPKASIQKFPYTELNGEPKVIPSKEECGGCGQMTIAGLRVLSSGDKIGLRNGSLSATFSILITYDDDLGESHHAEYCDVFDWTPYNDICPWPVQND